MRRLLLPLILVSAMPFLAAACGSSTSSTNSTEFPTAPSSAAAPSLADFAGTWYGLVHPPTDSGVISFTWTITQTNGGLSGACQIGIGNGGHPLIDGVGGAGADTRNPIGTMTGTLTGSGNQMAFAMSFPARVGNSGPGGSFTNLGVPNCGMMASGSGYASSTVMSGNLGLSWGAPCTVNNLGQMVSITSGTLSFSKQ